MRPSEYLNIYLKGLLNSYGQVFFCKDIRLSIILLGVSFFDLGSGFGGVLAILTTQLFATLFGYSKQLIEDGTISYNSLMVGLGIGIFYEWNLSILALIPIASGLTFLLTAWFMNSLGQKKLPFLSIPFLLGTWIILLGAGNFSLSELNSKDSLSLYAYFPELFLETSAWIDNWPGGDYWHLLFRSTGAIFFQFNDLAGMLVLVALFFQSRISFVLGVFGFSVGYFFYQGLEGDFSQLIYAYIGFNFILTGIALGGFFLIPNWRSFLLVAMVIPLAAMMISALHEPFTNYGLPLFSLPFNILVLLVLLANGLREKNRGLIPVIVQRYSPESNLYHQQQYQQRFGDKPAINLGLPILGEWYISQDKDGEITHLGDYRFAWDFDIRDSEGFTHKAPGNRPEDYFCYNMPVVSPAEGTVVAIQDLIPDNEIGGMNLKRNWGNSIVIQHGIGLYSQLSHLKSGSFQVAVGDYVQRGQVLAKCGNSGRSPEPHLHFQIQTFPKIGSPTIEYPIGIYVTGKGNDLKVERYSSPKLSETVRNFKKLELLSKAFGFIPGQHLVAKKEEITENWSIHTDAFNQTYFHCKDTKSTAYFFNDGFQFRFTEFYGSRKGLLYEFYLAAFSIQLGAYSKEVQKDQLDPTHLTSYGKRLIQDLVSPITSILKVNYEESIKELNDANEPTEAVIDSKVSSNWLGKKGLSKDYQLRTTFVENAYHIQLTTESGPISIKRKP